MTSRWVLLLYTACLLAGFAIFLRGFLVAKTPIHGFAAWGDLVDPRNDRTETGTGQNEAECDGDACDWSSKPTGTSQTNDNLTKTEIPVPAQFQRLIMVLVDALRADFVLPIEEGSSLSHMEFVRKIITENKTLSFLAKAHPPTVTLPRIKALTTGDVPGFIDIVLNFDSTELKEDNLISQFQRHDKKMVFYGDDTWLKLFPNHFIRQEGTTSFFVTDYTEVDENVTRHLGDELEATDWDVLILHYLGLDHIGHLAGPRSPLVQPKLTEMDLIIKRIYYKLIEQDLAAGTRSLLVLCGDHGMSDQGSHGGSSAQEVNTPFVMMSSSWDGGTGSPLFSAGVDQVDSVPTLSLLFGLPVPQNSLGTVILPALRGYSALHQMAALYANTQQLIRVFMRNVANYKREPCYEAARRAVAGHRAWLVGGAQSDRVGVTQARYILALGEMKARLVASLSKYDLHAMVAGIVLLWVTCLSVLLGSVGGGRLPGRPGPGAVLAACVLGVAGLSVHVVLCTGPYASPHLCPSSLVAMATATGYFLLLCACLTQLCLGAAAFHVKKLGRVNTLSPSCWLLLAGTGGHTVTLMASSLVEEEHQTWYLLTTTACLFLSLRTAIRVVVPLTSTNGHYRCSEGSHKVEKRPDEQDAYFQMQQMLSLHAQCFDCSRPADAGKKPAQGRGTLREVAGLLAVLVSARVARAWNQTGDKWAHLPDIGDWLVEPSHQVAQSVAVAVALGGVVAARWRRGASWMSSNFLVAGATGVYVFRAATGAVLLPGLYGATVEKGLLEARMVWSLVATMLVHAVIHYRRAGDDEPGSPHHVHAHSRPGRRTMLLAHVQTVWTLVALLVLRPHNIPLVFLVSVMDVCLRGALRSAQTLPTWATALLFLWMGQATFFFQGNSNSISSVDVSAGYVGLNSYMPTLIGLLLFISTYVGPIYWMLSLLRLLSERIDTERVHNPRWRHVLGEVGAVWVAARAVPLAAYTALTAAQRYHLFVWTVFSPKLLYEGMLTVLTAAGILLLQLLHHT